MIAYLNFEKDKFLNITANKNHLYRVRFNTFIYEPDSKQEKVFFILRDKKHDCSIAVSCIDKSYFKTLFDFLVDEKGEQPEIDRKYTSFFNERESYIERTVI